MSAGNAPIPLDCPWCGESEESLVAASGLSPESALEAHAAECDSFVAEQGR
jgi:hypothetical protein